VLPDIIEVSSTSGLIPADKLMLEHRLRQLEALDAKRAMLGGNEAVAILRLMHEVRTRLEPPTPQELNERTQKVIDGFRLTVDWVREALASAEAA
jgi:hypothetical protein